MAWRMVAGGLPPHAPVTIVAVPTTRAASPARSWIPIIGGPHVLAGGLLPCGHRACGQRTGLASAVRGVVLRSFLRRKRVALCDIVLLLSWAVMLWLLSSLLRLLV